jgi:heme-degrading monooxygenase HmoA
MYARMTAVQVAPDQAENAIAAYLDSVPKAAKEMGAKGSVLLINRETGEGLSFSLWGDEQSMHASAERASELRRSTTGQTAGSEVTRVEHYEVVHLEMDEAP